MTQSDIVLHGRAVLVSKHVNKVKTIPLHDKWICKTLDLHKLL